MEIIRKINSYNKDTISIAKDLFNKATLLLKEAEKTKNLNLFYQAICIYQDSIDVYPRNAKPYIALSFISWKMNEHEKALSLLKKAREYDSFDTNISKQIKLIKDDFIEKEKSKILKKISNKVIEEKTKESENVILESFNSIKSFFGVSEEKNISIENQKQIKKQSIFSFGKKENSSINMFEELAKIKEQKENVKIKVSNNFINKVRSI